jgi:hypothetical protein
VHPDLLAAMTARGGVFTRADALAAGYTSEEIRGRLAAGRWVRLRRGAYTVPSRGAAPDPRREHLLRAAATLAVLGSQPVASHRTAAVVLGVPLLGGVPSEVEVTSARMRSRRGPGVIVHPAPLPAAEVRHGLGLAHTSAARTAVDLSRTLPFREAVIAVDHCRHRRLAGSGELDAVLAGQRTWWGAPKARRVLDFSDALAESPGESLSRVAIVASGLPRPRLQVWIGDSMDPVGRVDFLFEDERTVGEFDGLGKYTDRRDLVAEKLREDRLRDLGLEVVRWVWADVVGDFGPTAARLRAAFARRRRTA